jgi:hypothetical protein
MTRPLQPTRHLSSPATPLKCLLSASVLALLGACGGGGGDTAPTASTAPKAWQGAALIETNSAGDAGEPQIAFDASGNALAVWHQSDGMRDNIYANRFSPGTGWGTAELVEIDNAGGASSPQIAFDASGNALAVWRQSDGMRNNIYANRFSPGTGWAAAELIEIDNAGTANNPQIAFDASGNALAVWEQSDGMRRNIWANRFSPGTGWAAAELIEINNAGGAYGPQIAFDPSGNALAVWEQSDGMRTNIYANRFSPGTGWGAAELIEIDNAGDAYRPQIAFDASGNALAVWRQYDGMRYNIWANRFSPGTGWGAAELIEIDNAGDAYYPQIAFDASGNALAVWRQFDGMRTSIYANRFSPATGWGAAELVEVNNAGSAGSPQIAFDASGNALAVWQQSDGMRENIWANRFSPGTGWGTAELLEINNAGGSSNPQIAFDATGNALAVWQQFDGVRDSVWANRYQ